jgi:hypothetical protein
VVIEHRKSGAPLNYLELKEQEIKEGKEEKGRSWHIRRYYDV